MANPLLIGGLILGGTVAAWRIVRRERKRLRALAERIALHTGAGREEAPVRLERDPVTGVYRPSDHERDPASRG